MNINQTLETFYKTKKNDEEQAKKEAVMNYITYSEKYELIKHRIESMENKLNRHKIRIQQEAVKEGKKVTDARNKAELDDLTISLTDGIMELKLEYIEYKTKKSLYYTLINTEFM